MPELPEVETVVRALRPLLQEQRLNSMSYSWAKTIATPTPEEFQNRVVGQTVQALSRRAKYIVIHLTHDFLLVHLKMTGHLYVVAQEEQHRADQWVRVKFGLAEGKELRFSDPRKFGRVYLTADLNTIVGGLGPEPLEDAFTVEMFKTRLQRRDKIIKALLLDQSFIAGVGNIYADEALLRAKIHPLRNANRLTHTEIDALYHTVRQVLQAGIDHEGASINSYRKPDGTQGESQEHFLAYGRDGLPCLVCGTVIEKIWVAQRGTHFCPHCQPLQKG
jgi:formamidopyrimidine-DNA glycosylase